MITFSPRSWDGAALTMGSVANAHAESLDAVGGRASFFFCFDAVESGAVGGRASFFFFGSGVALLF